MVENFRSLRTLCDRFQVAESRSKYHATTNRTKDTKDSGNYYISISSFVLFATFVVNICFDFGCGVAALGLRGAISESCFTSKPKTSKLERMFVEY